MNKYPARHEYMVNVTVKGEEKSLRIGKVLVVGSLVLYYRREPLDVAYFRNGEALSIDKRALPQWDRDGVSVIHFVDARTRVLYAITRDEWHLYCFDRDNGAGLQSYVLLRHFMKHPEGQLYREGYTKVELMLDPLPPAGWTPIAEPAPAAPSPQGGLFDV